MQKVSPEVMDKREKEFRCLESEEKIAIGSLQRDRLRSKEGSKIQSDRLKKTRGGEEFPCSCNKQPRRKRERQNEVYPG